jgi:uncharacterized protein
MGNTQNGKAAPLESAGAAAGRAVVTGASSGIGKIYADRLAQRGFDLLLVARRADKLAALAQTLRAAHGVAVTTMAADLCNAEALEKVAAHIAADAGITMLVNDAGTATMGPLANISNVDARSMIDLNITALVRLTLAVLPGFKERNRGVIVNLGSVLGFHSLPISSAYSGTKGYVLNFTRGLQDELAATNIRVQLVLPSFTATDIWELAGVPLSRLDQTVIMSAENCVDAALAGLELRCGAHETAGGLSNQPAGFAVWDQRVTQIAALTQPEQPVNTLQTIGSSAQSR